MKVKVCGITKAAQLASLVAGGADYAGFIFYERSPRFAGNKLDARTVREVGNGIRKVGVFVNAPQQQVLQIIRDYGLDAAQLHGDESPEYCAAVKTATVVIKAFRIGGEMSSLDALAAYEGVCDYFLFDTAGKDYGGNGQLFDWTLLEQYPYKTPFFLSGGIGPAQVQILLDLKLPGLFAVDVNSKFETAPGVKDMQQVQTFIDNIKQSPVK
ncbi:phosphoribosylanthranilate isomerase [Chitinophaga horti]|uniref:N-(5'-phosphoribosyl)anthranilate isomerase n=1 Tax=Chitinophaga horti TaxID=2920382 RepID=A0ABY6J2H8_9BACT|nr:phosphoribosylanthranilate isomerase [Chitinophaga horti]UYQ93840.1 phosphoribosylanthranilate isomerase [Chitinophaga horti]